MAGDAWNGSCINSKFRFMKDLSVNNLLGIKYLKKNDIELIFKTAENFKNIINQPIKKVPSLRDITIANLFFENSTRTKLSFELAQKRLSADVINFSRNILKPKGVLVAKLFMGEDFEEVKNLAKSLFKKVNFFKPESSKKESKETYLHCEFLKTL